MKLYHKNPRQITDKQFTDLGGSLSRLGDLGGIVHDLNSDEIIGGNQRSRVFDINQCDIQLTEQYAEPDEQGTVGLGFVIWKGKKYAYRQVRWTAKQCEEANIRANKNGGSFDFDTLANEFELDDLLEWGFERKELDLDLWASEKPDDPGAQIDKAEELREKWGVESGQLWKLGEHRLICGDCTDRTVVERVMGGEKAEICVSDPPYGVLDEKWDRYFEQSDFDAIINTTDGMIALFNAAKPEIILRMLSISPMPERIGVWRHSQIMPRPGMIWSWQPIFYWRCSDAVAWDSLDWYQGNSDKNGTHPTQKPIEFFEKIINSIKCKTVYDPFLGSGTTLIACERLGRKCRAVEISPAYCAVAIQRWVDMTGGIPELLDVQT